MKDLGPAIQMLKTQGALTYDLLNTLPHHPAIPTHKHMTAVLHDGTDVTAALRLKEAWAPDLGCAMNLELGLVRMYGTRLPGSVGVEVKGKLALALAIALLLAMQEMQKKPVTEDS